MAGYICLLLSVYFQVNLKMIFLWVSFFTVATFAWSLCVFPQVKLKIVVLLLQESLSQWLHNYGISPVYILKCTSRGFFVKRLFTIATFVWPLSCMFPQVMLKIVAWSQRLHRYGFFSVCIFKCNSKWYYCEKAFSQQLQLCGLSPVFFP